MSFEERLTIWAGVIDTELDRRLYDYPGGPLWEAMQYGLMGGKRLRGFLVLETAALHDIPSDKAIGCAMGIEALHAYSLIHEAEHNLFHPNHRINVAAAPRGAPLKL